MKHTPAFEIDEDNTEAVLCCPHCEHNYTHHTKITVYSRPHEDGAIRTTTIHSNGDTQAQANGGCRSPSSRRDGLTVEFYCEGCGGRAELTIAQHKGQTCLRTRGVAS